NGIHAPGRSRQVALKSIRSQQGDWRKGLAAACESLVHPVVLAGEARRLHSRLVGLLLGAPLFAGALLVQMFHDRFSATALLTLISATIAAGWLAAAGASAIRNAQAAITVALGALTVAVGCILAVTGVFSSPLLLLLLALPFEHWWLRRSVWRGAFAMAAALVLSLVLQPSHPATGFSAAMWLVPICYAATAWLRLPRPETAAIEAPQQEASDEAAARLGGGTVL